MKYITRFAPSPTGPLHLGGARTAIFNWLAARATGGRFYLRVDDTDKERSRSEYTDEIKAGLTFLGLNWDGEYHQSRRQDVHNDYVDALVSAGHAKLGDDGCVSLCLSEERAYDFWTDRVNGNIPISEENWNHIRTARLTRYDGGALYNVASVADDLDIGVNFIIRGQDHVTNTSLQYVLRQLHPANQPLEYAHVGLIHGPDGKKLSKRSPEDRTLLSEFIADGYDPDALFNFLLRLGWGVKHEDRSVAILTREQAIELFLDGGNLKPNPARMDMAKLDNYDRKFKGRKEKGQL
jgi:glutamyl-tRNA synthetase